MGPLREHMAHLTNSNTTVQKLFDKLNLSNRTICIHSSFSKLSKSGLSPNYLIDLFLDNGCTLVAPSFTYDTISTTKVDSIKYKRNGIGDNDIFNISSVNFFPESTSISSDMGIISKTILLNKNSSRGFHPINSICSIGKNSNYITSKQDLNNVYGCYEACLEFNSVLLLIDVDLTKATPIHYAEKISGRTLFRSWANIVIDGSVKKVEVEVGSCSNGFNRLLPHFVGNFRTEIFQQSHFHVFDFKYVISTASELIRKNPTLTKCNDPFCIRCRDAINGGPILS